MKCVNLPVWLRECSVYTQAPPPAVVKTQTISDVKQYTAESRNLSSLVCMISALVRRARKSESDLYWFSLEFLTVPFFLI